MTFERTSGGISSHIPLRYNCTTSLKTTCNTFVLVSSLLVVLYMHKIICAHTYTHTVYAQYAQAHNCVYVYLRGPTFNLIMTV